MTTIEFVQTIPPNILPVFLEYNNGNTNVESLLKTPIPKNANKHIPNVILIDKISNHPTIVSNLNKPILSELKFISEFVRNLDSADFLSNENKNVIFSNTIFNLLMILNCANTKMLMSYESVMVLDRLTAVKYKLIRNITYAEYCKKTMLFYSMYYENIAALMASNDESNTMIRCFTAMIDFLSTLFHLVKSKDIKFLILGSRLISPPAYIRKTLKKRLFLLLIIPDISNQVYHCLPKMLRLTTTERSHLKLFSLKSLNMAQYKLLTDSLPDIRNSNDVSCYKEFNQMLWYGHKKQTTFYNDLSDSLLEGQEIKPITNYHKEDVLKQMITFLLPNYYLFWKKNNWNNNLEVQKRIHYIKNVKQWKPDIKKLVKYVLYN